MQKMPCAEGTRFHVHLTKARGVVCNVATPFEARLDAAGGADIWTHSAMKDLKANKVADLTHGS
jgi:putative DNA primase/helicase